MAQGSTSPVTIAGAGVLGLAIAVELAGRGHRVSVLDPASEGANASSIAAGLLAPVGEAVFDAEAAGQFPLLAQAMALWPAFAGANATDLVREPTRVPAAFADAIGPLDVSLRLTDGYAWYDGDARVADPAAALAGLRQRLVGLGGRIIAGALTDPVGEGPTIVAVGPGVGPLVRLAPELAHVTPVKGQIAVLPHGPAEGPTIRWRGGYLAPQPGGARVGATMEIGRDDVTVEPEAIASLIDRAKAEVDWLNTQSAYGVAGVRMATPDGLPLVGPSRTQGVWLAVGARRNGWLLAPLVASQIAAYVAGDNPGPWATALHPARFD